MGLAVNAVALVAASFATTSSTSVELSWLAPGESIVVLESPQFHFDWEHRRLPLHIDLFHCATDTLHAKYPQIRLIRESEFVKQAFPDLDPSAAPVSPESLTILVDNETFRTRIAPLHVRYLLYGATENDVETVSESFGCLGEPAAAVCFGSGEWEKRSSYSVLVMDLKQHQESRKSGVEAGKSWFGTLVPFFVGWKSPTEERVCTSLGRDVLALFEERTVPVGMARKATP